MQPRRVLVVVSALVVGGALVGCGSTGGYGAAGGSATTSGGGGAPAAASGAEGVGDDRPAIVAAGVGRASGPPDSMVVSLNIHTDGATAAETMDTASLRTIQLQQAARDQGVAEEDLRTTNVSVFPRFDAQGRRVVGYSADNSFTVTYRDLETAGGLLDGLVGIGGDFLQVHGVSLQLDDSTALLDEARTDAVERASAQAEQLAAAAGVELGPVRRIVEVPVGSSFGEQATAALGGGNVDRDLSIAVPIAGGGQEVIVQVQVVYDVGPASG